MSRESWRLRASRTTSLRFRFERRQNSLRMRSRSSSSRMVTALFMSDNVIQMAHTGKWKGENESSRHSKFPLQLREEALCEAVAIGDRHGYKSAIGALLDLLDEAAAFQGDGGDDGFR